MRNFPQYKLEDFYRKHFYEGGLNIFQIRRMYEFLADDRKMDMRFHAAIHGIDLDKEKNKNSSDQAQTDLQEQQKKQELPIFMDPDSYDNMSDEEKQKLTEKMMSKHRQWAGQSISTLGKDTGSKDGR